MTNLFVAHTPFQIFVGEAIVSQLLSSQNERNLLMLELPHAGPLALSPVWSAVEQLEPTGSSTVGRQRFLAAERNLEVIRRHAAVDPDTRIFLSDIAWPLNNRVFFDRRLRRLTRFALYSDGIGTYVRPRVTRALFLRGLAKQVNGLLGFGVRYRNYTGSHFGVDRNEIEGVYAPRADLVQCDCHKQRDVSLATTATALAFKPEKGLFLDQPYWLHMNDEKWAATMHAAVAFMASLGLRSWHYKAHHAGRPAEVNFYATLGYQPVRGGACAEQLVADHDFGTIVSYSSSALFNLKCMYGDRLRCIALFTPEISTSNGYNDDTSAAVTQLFRTVGVEIAEQAMPRRPGAGVGGR